MPEPSAPSNPTREAAKSTPAVPAPNEKVQKQLDQALEDSFPASDPVSIVTSQEEEDWGEGDWAPAVPAPTQKR